MALTDYHTGIHPVVSHTPRENNTWADQLTHRDTTGFDPAKQFHININEWYILDRLIALHHKQ